MAYISNPNEISFNGESLRGFVIEEINDEKIEINDIEVKFQINRAIVFDIVIDRNDIDKNELKTIKGRFLNIISLQQYMKLKILAQTIHFLDIDYW